MNNFLNLIWNFKNRVLRKIGEQDLTLAAIAIADRHSQCPN